jgi:hypothetical protein
MKSPAGVSFHRFVQPPGADTVDGRKVAVEDHAMSSQYQN